MSVHTITRVLEIDAGHRLLRHEGKCRNYHGHRYVWHITCGSNVLDNVGRVIDFSVVKELVGGWLDEHFDHGMILQQGDPMLPLLVETGCKHFVVEFSPTSENLAAYVKGIATDLLSPHGVEVISVTCFETPNCFSIAQ